MGRVVPVSTHTYTHTDLFLYVMCMCVYVYCSHPAVSSALPPPSSAPVWAAEPIPPSEPRSPSSADPEPRRSLRTLHHQSSSATQHTAGCDSVLTTDLCSHTTIGCQLFYTCPKLMASFPSFIAVGHLKKWNEEV